jgi:hypothetical protein
VPQSQLTVSLSKASNNNHQNKTLLALASLAAFSKLPSRLSRLLCSNYLMEIPLLCLDMDNTLSMDTITHLRLTDMVVVTILLKHMATEAFPKAKVVSLLAAVLVSMMRLVLVFTNKVDTVSKVGMDSKGMANRVVILSNSKAMAARREKIASAAACFPLSFSAL